MRFRVFDQSAAFAFQVLFALFYFLSLAVGEAAEPKLVVAAPPDWVTKTFEEKEGLLHVVYKAPGERDAALIIHDQGPIDPKRVNEDSMPAFHSLWFKNMFGSEPARDNHEMLKTEHGVFWLSVYEDPDLIGKPIVKADYKYIVEVLGLIDGEYLVNCAILVQEKDGADLAEAKGALAKIRVK